MSILTTPYILDIEFAAGASISNAINLDGKNLVALIIPSAWTGSSITLQACHRLDVETPVWNDLRDMNGLEIVIPVATNSQIQIEPAKLVGLKYMRVRNGTSASPVNQAAARLAFGVVREVQ
jgi:hypothetical protein